MKAKYSAQLDKFPVGGIHSRSEICAVYLEHYLVPSRGLAFKVSGVNPGCVQELDALYSVHQDNCANMYDFLELMLLYE